MGVRALSAPPVAVTAPPPPAVAAHSSLAGFPSSVGRGSPLRMHHSPPPSMMPAQAPLLSMAPLPRLLPPNQVGVAEVVVGIISEGAVVRVCLHLLLLLVCPIVLRRPMVRVHPDVAVSCFRGALHSEF
jgi:hypothetical protein